MKELIEEIKKVNSWKKAKPPLLKLLEQMEQKVSASAVQTEVQETPTPEFKEWESKILTDQDPLKESASNFVEAFKKDIRFNAVDGTERPTMMSAAGLENLNRLFEQHEVTDKSVIVYAPDGKKLPEKWSQRLKRLGYSCMLTDTRLEVLLDKSEPNF